MDNGFIVIHAREPVAAPAFCAAIVHKSTGLSCGRGAVAGHAARAAVEDLATRDPHSGQLMLRLQIMTLQATQVIFDAHMPFE